MDYISDSITNYLTSKCGLSNLKKPALDKDFLTKDLCYAIHSSIPQGKGVNPEEVIKKIADDVNSKLKSDPHPFIDHVEGAGRGFLNITLNRKEIMKYSFTTITKLGENYGKSDIMKGKKAVVEHTSTNPNSTIHVGNLRSTITGAFVANLLRWVGYDVEEWFFVNDLGAQIGLTFVGFKAVYPILKPQMKIDLWVGLIYACSNTLNNFQECGWVLTDATKLINEGKENELLEAIKDEEKKEKAKGFIADYKDIRSRVPELMDILTEKLSPISIYETSADWNLRYERGEEEAIREMRRMVILTLSGQQETLDLFSIHHDCFSFESELGWEGSNDYVLNAIKKTPYFIDRTMCNSKGVPQGGYLNFKQYIDDFELPVGKKGYQSDYPPLYIVRPNGSTLYSFRDLVFSIKKGEGKNLVLNAIASEQNLGQEKVQLGLRIIHPATADTLYHLSYELVTLTDRRMSGRRGLFVTADEVYSVLKEKTEELIREREMKKKEGKTDDEEEDGTNEAELSSSSSSSSSSSTEITSFTPSELSNITSSIASSAMIYTLLSCSPHTKLIFNTSLATDPHEASAPFLLYNYARLCSILRNYDEMVSSHLKMNDEERKAEREKDGEAKKEEEEMYGKRDEKKFTPLCNLEDVDFSLLEGNGEWRLLLKYVLYFPNLVINLALPPFPSRPSLPTYPVHLLPEYLINYVRSFSSFYKANRIIIPYHNNITHARIWLVKIFKQVLENGIRLMMMKPLERM